MAELCRPFDLQIHFASEMTRVSTPRLKRARLRLNYLYAIVMQRCGEFYRSLRGDVPLQSTHQKRYETPICNVGYQRYGDALLRSSCNPVATIC
jgi:hypothetical protein